MEPDSVAVIVTTYNAPDYLRRVLTGYLGQSVAPSELLVADDGSTAETAEVVAEFACQANFPIRHIWHEDQGFRAARIRNQAISQSDADYLLLSDGDCIPHPDFVVDHRRLARRGRFIQGKRLLVTAGLSPFFNGGRGGQVLGACLRRELGGAHHLLRIPGLAFGKKDLRGIKTCNFGVFRDDLIRVNGFNEDFVGWGREDSELVVRLFRLGLKRYDPPFSALVYHLWHAENDRTRLNDNDELLATVAQSGDYRCRNGLEKLTT